MGSDAVVAIQQLGNEIKNLQVQVNMDGRKVGWSIKSGTKYRK